MRAANRDNAPMNLSLIAALDRNYAIGRAGAIPRAADKAFSIAAARCRG
jgi:hypothetical protein